MLNVNIGLLGHVDSGKTALAKALSRTASTAAFDKSPQSQSRGITLDLGFSACEVTCNDADDATRNALGEAQVDKVQCTLVDCPGHASLIRTVVGGAQIIDAIVLVVDATKGVQAQTAECLVLGEVLSKPLVVALNKVDAIQGSTPQAKEAARAALRKKLQQTFKRTRWPNVAIVEAAAAPRESDGSIGAPCNTQAVLSQVLQTVDLAVLKATKEHEGMKPEHFYMLVDHCFAVRGQGTVFTGTVAAGVVRVGDAILAPELQVTKKVKGLQVFHKPVVAARSGDRVGLCVAQFDPESMERGVLCSAAGKGRALVSSAQLIARVHRVRYHPLPCDTQTKFHITIGHTTVMGTMRYFARPAASSSDDFDPFIESTWVEQLGDETVAAYALPTGHPNDSSVSSSWKAGRPLPEATAGEAYYAVLLLEKPALAAPGSSLVAMRLDVERENFCRIALAGTVVYTFNESGAGAGVAAGASVCGASANEALGKDTDAPAWRRLPVVRYRTRTLYVDRVLDARSCIADGVVSLESSGPHVTAAASGSGPRKGSSGTAAGRQKSELFSEVQKFVRLKVMFEPDSDSAEDRTAEQQRSAPGREVALAAAAVTHASVLGSVSGIIDSTFGKTGKVKLVFDAPVFANPATAQAAAKVSGEEAGGAKSKSKKSDDMKSGSRAGAFLRPGRVVLVLKKYPFALHSGLDQ